MGRLDDLEVVADKGLEWKAKCQAITAERDQLRADLAEERARRKALDRNWDALQQGERDAQSTAAGLRRALEEADKAIEQVHDEWAEPVSAHDAGAGQAAAICFAASMAIETALAASPDDHARRLKAEAIAEYIDDHGQKCDDCQHVMIDVTAAETGCASHCFAGDPEGDGSGCAWGFHHDAERNERRIKAEALRDAAREIMKFPMTGTLSCVVRALEAEADRLEAANGR